MRRGALWMRHPSRCAPSARQPWYSDPLVRRVGGGGGGKREGGVSTDVTLWARQSVHSFRMAKV